MRVKVLDVYVKHVKDEIKVLDSRQFKITRQCLQTVFVVRISAVSELHLRCVCNVYLALHVKIQRLHASRCVPLPSGYSPR